MRFVKEHLIGILVGFVIYELYWRSATGQQGGPGGRRTTG